MTIKEIQECIDLLNTDEIDAKEQVKEKLQKELASKMFCNEKAVIPQDFMYCCIINDISEMTTPIKEMFINNMGKALARECLKDINLRVMPYYMMPPAEMPFDEFKGMKISTRFKFYVCEVFK